MILALAKEILVDHLHLEVLTATTATEAILTAASEHPELIILDVNMTDQDGVSICRSLKARHDTKDIPVVFLSGDRTDSVVLDGFKAGATDYIFKPFSPPILAARVLNQLELNRKTRRLEIISNTDSLTELPNRAAFNTYLSAQLNEQAKREQDSRHTVEESAEDNSFTLLFIDLDHFKAVNDEMGHEVGDQLLQVVAGRLQKNLREGDLVARIGGDEFVAMLMGVEQPKDVETVAQKVIDLMCQPFQFKGKRIQIGASVGSARFPFDARDGEELVRYADLAMYTAKAKGRSNHVAYTQALGSEVEARQQIVDQLWHAIDHGELLLHFQPKVPLKEKEIVGLDALLRWNHPTRGELPAAEFIEQLMQGELGQRAERHITELAFQHILACHNSDRRCYPISINLSNEQFKQPEIGQYFIEIADEVGLPHSLLTNIEIDIPEPLFFDDLNFAKEKITQLRAIGVKVFIDHFAAQDILLTNLHELDIDGIKLCRALTSGVGDPNLEKKLKLASSLSTIFEKPLIAVGIESDTQLAFLEQIECEGGQGFYLHKPMRAEELVTILPTH